MKSKGTRVFWPWLQGAKATEFHAGNKNTLSLVDLVRSILRLFSWFFPSKMMPQFMATFYFLFFLQVSFETSKVDDYYVYSYVHIFIYLYYIYIVCAAASLTVTTRTTTKKNTKKSAHFDPQKLPGLCLASQVLRWTLFCQWAFWIICGVTSKNPQSLWIICGGSS